MNVGLDQTNDLVKDNNISLIDLKVISNELEKLGPFEHGLIRTIKMEHKVVFKTIDDLLNNTTSINHINALPGNFPTHDYVINILPGYYFKPNLTKRKFADFYRNFIQNESKSPNKISNNFEH